MLDYKGLKSIASRVGVSPSKLLALAPTNDPFYVGAPGQLEKGQWFAKVYEAMGSPTNCHIRRVHYWLVTTQRLAKPNGAVYENTDNDWSLLTLASKYARYLGLVPINNIVDRRNPEPVVNVQNWKHTTPSKIAEGIDEDNIIDGIVSQFYCYNPSETQAYLLECWAEKSTMNDVLVPLCQRYGMNLVTGLGELSITAVYQLAERIIDTNKPVRIIYISDFDPAGEGMPISAARKIEYFVRTHEIAQDIKLIPLLLTAEQCETYSLPRSPIKNPKNNHRAYMARKRKFESRHGSGATELDAMEALYPGEMAKIIESAIEPYFDISAWNEAFRKNREVQKRVRAYLIGGDCEECKGEGGGEVGGDWHECSACAGTGSIPGRIGTEIMSDLSTSDLDSYSPPKGELNPNPDSTPCIYNSALDYISQIELYRSHRNQRSEDIENNPFDDDTDTDSNPFKE